MSRQCGWGGVAVIAALLHPHLMDGTVAFSDVAADGAWGGGAVWASSTGALAASADAEPLACAPSACCTASCAILPMISERGRRYDWGENDKKTRAYGVESNGSSER